MVQKCFNCEYWEPISFKEHWGKCSGQDLPQCLELEGEAVLETEDHASCAAFQASAEAISGELHVRDEYLDDLEDHFYELVRDQGLCNKLS